MPCLPRALVVPPTTSIEFTDIESDENLDIHYSLGARVWCTSLYAGCQSCTSSTILHRPTCWWNCPRQSRARRHHRTSCVGFMKIMSAQVSIAAEPAPAVILPSTTALVLIDMQRDFMEPGGFGESMGNDVSVLRKAIGPCGDLLAASRDAGLLVVHTREGHRPDLSDLPRYIDCGVVCTQTVATVPDTVHLPIP